MIAVITERYAEELLALSSADVWFIYSQFDVVEDFRRLAAARKKVLKLLHRLHCCNDYTYNPLLAIPLPPRQKYGMLQMKHVTSHPVNK